MLYIKCVAEMCDDSSTVISLPPSQSPPPSLLLHALLRGVFSCAPRGTEVRCNHAGGVRRIISAALLFLCTQTGWGRDRVTSPLCEYGSCHFLSYFTVHASQAPCSRFILKQDTQQTFSGTKASAVPSGSGDLSALCPLNT